MIARLATLVGHVPKPPLIPKRSVPWLVERGVGADVVAQAWSDCFHFGFTAGFGAGAVLASLVILVVIVIGLGMTLLLRGAK